MIHSAAAAIPHFLPHHVWKTVFILTHNAALLSYIFNTNVKKASGYLIHLRKTLTTDIWAKERLILLAGLMLLYICPKLLSDLQRREWRYKKRRVNMAHAGLKSKKCHWFKLYAMNVTSVSAGNGGCSAGRTAAPLLTVCLLGRNLQPAVFVGKLKEGLGASVDSDGHP